MSKSYLLFMSHKIMHSSGSTKIKNYIKKMNKCINFLNVNYTNNFIKILIKLTSNKIHFKKMCHFHKIRKCGSNEQKCIYYILLYIYF